MVQHFQGKGAPLLRWASRLFMMAGLLAIGYAAYFYASAYAFQEMQTASFVHSSVTTVSPFSRPTPSGEMMGRIEIGRLGLSAVFVQGDSEQILSRAVGHVPETAMPGELGNIALAGHRDTFFRALRKIQQGDKITLETTGGEYEYTVESTAVVSPNETEVLRSFGKEELTLITCYPFGYIGAAPNRFIVRARRIEDSRD